MDSITENLSPVEMAKNASELGGLNVIVKKLPSFHSTLCPEIKDRNIDRFPQPNPDFILASKTTGSFLVDLKCPQTLDHLAKQQGVNLAFILPDQGSPEQKTEAINLCLEKYQEMTFKGFIRTFPVEDKEIIMELFQSYKEQPYDQKIWTCLVEKCSTHLDMSRRLPPLFFPENVILENLSPEALEEMKLLTPSLMAAFGIDKVLQKNEYDLSKTYKELNELQKKIYDQVFKDPFSRDLVLEEVREYKLLALEKKQKQETFRIIRGDMSRSTLLQEAIANDKEDRYGINLSSYKTPKRGKNNSEDPSD